MHIRRTTQSGSGYIDVIVGIGLMTLVFLGIFGVIQLSVQVIGNNKAKVGAIALAVEQMEYLRSLPYNDVAVLGGVPAGTIASSTTETINNITYTRRTSIRYIDDPADGLDSGSDTIPTDYKVAKVTVEWQLRDDPKSVTLVSNIVPKGLESALPGTGSLYINVIDALGSPIAGADVTFINNLVSPAINETRLSDIDGVASILGAPTSTSGYEITVSDTGYSTAQTYAATTSNPNPSPGHLTVVEDTITSSTFAIDRVATTTIQTYRASTSDVTIDLLNDATYIAATSNAVLNSGELELDEVTPGIFYAVGSMSSVYVDSSGDIIEWGELDWGEAEPSSTNVDMQVYYENASGTRTLIPNSDLPGNSSGFSTGPVDLSGLDVSIYTRLSIEATLSTGASAATPDLRDWTIDYVYGPVIEPNILIDVTGAKTIGTNGSSAPIYKYATSVQTDSNGSYVLTGLEWDTYTFTIDPSHNVDTIRNCVLTPYNLAPAADVVTEFIFATGTTHSLLVSVTDASTGATIDDASVRLYRASSSFDDTRLTTRCGQTFWGDMSLGTDGGGNGYSVDVSATGYISETRTGTVDISGDSVLEIALST